MDQIGRQIRDGGGRGRGGGGASVQALATLAQESFDILTLLPTYIENTKVAVTDLSKHTKVCHCIVKEQGSESFHVNICHFMSKYVILCLKMSCHVKSKFVIS
jgi:hypothetical protein